ncbi:hypothetical protein FQA39_LY17130 [Lamprigera yunnana]|nr:hypothetical protein FQA39_LY17130 [Lamprigera yunnana]
MALQRVVKPSTRKGKRVLEGRDPEVIEGPKHALIFHGRKVSNTIKNVLKDIYNLKKPEARLLSRKNDITVFENCVPLEDLCRKNETPLFIMGSHSKKRPDNIVIGRMFNYSLLDMVELGINAFEGLVDFLGPKIVLGGKSLLIFNGPSWEENDALKHLKSIFVDFFHREYIEGIRLQGIEHTLSFTATEEGNILLRSYKVLFKKSGCRTPRIELEEMGPRIDFTLRRSKLPSEDLMKKACKKPSVLKVTKKKNVSRDGLGTLNARLHVGKQNIQNIQTRKMKGLKRTPEEKKAAKRSFYVEANVGPISNKRVKVN